MADVPAPMAGSIFQILVAVGDTVSEADELVILESMKMEIPIEAPSAGTVGSIAVEVGQSVQEGDRLLTLE